MTTQAKGPLAPPSEELGAGHGVALGAVFAGGPASPTTPAGALRLATDAARLLKVPAGIRLVRVFAFAGGFAQQWQLANGLRVVLVPDAKALVVAYQTWIAAGSADELAGATGAAHLLEHLMFKSTETQPAGAFDRMLEAFGASANATTWLDWTAFHEVILPSRVAEVAALEADRLHRIRFEPAGVRAELGVVRNERSETVDDDPDAALAEVLYAAAYGSAPYGHPTIGWDRDLARLRAKQAKAFYTSHYGPDTAWLVLAGAVDTAAVLTAIVGSYGAIPKPKTPAPKRRTATLPKLGMAAKVVRIDAEADRLLVGWRTVPASHPDHPALTVLAEVLANSASARLSDALIHQHRLASHVAAEIPATRDAALLEVHVELLPSKHAADAERALDKVVSALLTGKPVTAAELSGARNRLLAERYAVLASAEGRADALGMFAAVLDDPTAYVRWWQAVRTVTVADLQRVAKTWLVAANRVVVYGQAEVGHGVELRQ